MRQKTNTLILLTYLLIFVMSAVSPLVFKTSESMDHTEGTEMSRSLLLVGRTQIKRPAERAKAAGRRPRYMGSHLVISGKMINAYFWARSAPSQPPTERV